MEKHAMLTFSNFSAYSVWLEVKHERISEPLIHAGGGVGLGLLKSSQFSMQAGCFAQLEYTTTRGGGLC